MSAAVDVEKIAGVAEAKVNDDFKSKANTATADKAATDKATTDKAATDKATPEKAVAAADNGTTKEVTEEEEDILSNISENTYMHLVKAAKRPMDALRRQSEAAEKKAKIDKIPEYNSEDDETLEDLEEEESDLDDSEEYGPFDEEEEFEDENAGADADEDEENDDDSGSGYELA